ncbi:MAG TPA: DUF6159 family protein [Chitinophagaceae bacterium]|nr:DUF6159 family protein [Chitinophagaceae bacterium]
MSFFDRLSNGWKLSMNSLKILKANQQLIIFPILSGISLLLVIGSFFTVTLANAGWDPENIGEVSSAGYYALLFLFYLVNYFIIVFFNMALIHCTRMYFKGEEVSVKAGLQFSLSRVGAIFSWAVFAATVGLILKTIQENSGLIGKIITGIIGIVWSVTTFFVVPVIAYENLGPIGAFKRSTQMMKQKWGESLAAGFSFGLIKFLAILIIGFLLFLIGSIVHPFLGIGLAVIAAFIIMAIMSAAETIFVSAVYHNINGDPVEHFSQQLIDGLFTKK